MDRDKKDIKNVKDAEDIAQGDDSRITSDKPKEGGLRNIFSREKFIGFLDRQGFYIVLFVCICIIGVTALITTGKDKKPYGEEQNEVQNGDYELDLDGNEYRYNLYSDMYKTDELGEDSEDMDDVNIKVEDVLTGDESEESSEEDKKDIGNSKEESKVEKEETDTQGGTTNVLEENVKEVSNPQDKTVSGSEKLGKTMLKPVQSDVIITDYAHDELIYSFTLKEWRTHPAIDIESELGSEVKAALDGVVQSIEEDSLMGIVITLDHGDNLITKYANLSTKDMVQVGQYLVKGQVISGVGKTASAETLDPPHLHFEVIMDGQNVDPKQFFE